MNQMHQLFREYLKKRRIIFTDIGDDILLIEYHGEALDKIPLVVNFGDEPWGRCLLMCMAICHCTEEEIPAALEHCNFLNRCIPTTNIHLDEEGNVCAMQTLKTHKEYFCDDVMEALSNLAEACDAAYMQFQEEMGK